MTTPSPSRAGAGAFAALAGYALLAGPVFIFVLYTAGHASNGCQVGCHNLPATLWRVLLVVGAVSALVVPLALGRAIALGQPATSVAGTVARTAGPLSAAVLMATSTPTIAFAFAFLLIPLWLRRPRPHLRFPYANPASGSPVTPTSPQDQP